MMKKLCNFNSILQKTRNKMHFNFFLKLTNSTPPARFCEQRTAMLCSRCEYFLENDKKDNHYRAKFRDKTVFLHFNIFERILERIQKKWLRIVTFEQRMLLQGEYCLRSELGSELGSRKILRSGEEQQYDSSSVSSCTFYT